MQSQKPPFDSAAAPRPRPVIARRLATGFATVAVTSLAMCTVLLALLAQVSKTVHTMRDGEMNVRNGLALATAVREQYTHLARTIIAGDHGDLAPYDRGVATVRAKTEALRREMPASELPKIDHLAEETAALDALFKQELVPALDRGDHAAVSRLHRRAEQLSSDAVRDADFLAASAERSMASWHTEAIAASRIGLLAGAGFMLLIVLLSVVYTRSIRRSVMRPLEALALAARRVGGGDFEGRLGAVGEGEFEAVAEAYDRMRDELRARETRILRAERMAVVGQLAAGVAHEINNPIGVIRGYLRTMTPDEAPQTLREELKIIDDEAASCQRIAEDLLAYARAEELHVEAVQIDELVGETVRRMVESGEAAGTPVELDTAPATVVADGRRIRQVVFNLVKNAIQVSPPEATVRVEGSRDDAGGYRVSVLDRGPGVEEQDRARVFEPFFSMRSGGSGLGLAVCQGIVRAHLGEIGVEAREGGGCVFHFVIPSRSGKARSGT
jgi:two-component system NtrC family sensor kinase